MKEKGCIFRSEAGRKVAQRFMSVDPLAEEYPAISPYVYTANNPIRYIDPNGMYFTERSQAYLERLNEYMENRIASYDKRIAKAEAKGKDKRVERLTRQRDNLSTKFNATRAEIAELAASDQAYDIYVSDKYSESGPIPGMGTDRGGATFNFSGGVFEIVLPKGNDVGFIAHELKHAHQFETGQYSVGPELEGEYKNLLYDKTDEVAAYSRGAAFGQRRYSLHDLPSEYDRVATGPVDITSHPNLKHILNAPAGRQQKAFQGIANATGHAFRVNGKTYYKKR